MSGVPAPGDGGSNLTAAAGKIMLMLMNEKIRFLAIAPARGPLNTAFVDKLCHLYTGAGMKVARLRLHSGNGSPPAHDEIEWLLSGPADGAVPPADDHGAERLKAPGGDIQQQLLNNPAALRAALVAGFKTQDLVTLELGPVLEQGHAMINPVAIATGCDGVMITYPLNCRRIDITAAEGEVARAGARLLGSVLDETREPNSLTALSDTLSRWRELSPRLAGRLEVLTREMASDY